MLEEEETLPHISIHAEIFSIGRVFDHKNTSYSSDDETSRFDLISRTHGFQCM